MVVGPESSKTVIESLPATVRSGFGVTLTVTVAAATLVPSETL
jgi:hypothetical protein